MQWTIHTHEDAVSFEVVVVARASRSGVVGVVATAHGAALKLTLAAPPVDGEANRELCSTLAKAPAGCGKRLFDAPRASNRSAFSGQPAYVIASGQRLCRGPLDVPTRSVQITHGEHNKHETVRVAGVSPERVRKLE